MENIILVGSSGHAKVIIDIIEKQSVYRIAGLLDAFSPDSPDEMASGQLRAPISAVRPNAYAGSGSRILTDATGERRNPQFRQRFRGLRSSQPNPSGESGFRAVGEGTLGYTVLGKEGDLPRLTGEHNLKGAIVAIGDNDVRSKVVSKIAAACPELQFLSAIHPSARVGKGSVIGDGTVLMAGTTVNPCCRVGRFCIVNTNASLDHDSVMDDFSSLAPGATTGGNCRIGAYAVVSIGATLRHGITIGEHSVVGAGSTVLRDVEAFSVVYGTPAKKIRIRQQGDKYL